MAEETKVPETKPENVQKKTKNVQEKPKTFMQRLIDVQVRLKAPKSQFNKFGGYNYRNCEDILTAVKPLLAENDLLLILSDEIVKIDDRYYVKASATVYDALSDEKISAPGFAREDDSKKGMDVSQITGASSSYARKYALNGLFCIDDTKDADSFDNTKSGTAPQKYVCAGCGKPFQANDKYTVQQIFEISKRMNTDGVARCSACMDKAGTRRK